MNKNKKIIVLIVLLLVVVSVGLAIENNINKENSIISKMTTSKDKDKQSDLSDKNSSGASSDENTTHVSSNPKSENGSYKISISEEDQKIEKNKLPYKLPDKSTITIEKVGQYSGQFLEDGKDEAVDGVFAIIVKNNADEMLQYAELKLKVDDGDATFVVTNLPPNKSALVLEFNKKSFSKTTNISYEETKTSYIDNNSMNEDKFKVEEDNTKLILKNLTNKSYSTIYVYYKNVDDNGSYLGGITYRTKFTDVKANTSIEQDTEHYLEGASEIVMVDYIE